MEIALRDCITLLRNITYNMLKRENRRRIFLKLKLKKCLIYRKNLTKISTSIIYFLSFPDYPMPRQLFILYFLLQQIY